MVRIKKISPFYNLRFLDARFFLFKKMSYVNIHRIQSRAQRLAQALGKHKISLYTTQTYFSIQSYFCINRFDIHVPFIQ